MGNGKVRAGGLNKKSWRSAVATVALLALGGCSTLEAVNPINWFRDTKNDPGADAPNSANLEAGSDQPYPNLASVPSTPTRGLTQAQRDALQQGLVADRENAHYADLQQRAGNAGAVPAPQVKVPEEQLVPVDLNNVPQQPPTPSPTLPRPSPAPAPTPVAAVRPTALPPPNALPPAPQAPRVTSVAPVAAPGASHLSVGGGLAASAPVAVSRESNLKTPTPREEPAAETPTEPPAEPNLPPVPAAEPVQPLVQTHPVAPSNSLSVGGIPLPPSTPSRAEPTPAVPDLPAAPVVQSAAAPPVPGKRSVSVPAAQIQFAAGSNALSVDATASLNAVPGKLKGHDGGVIRVVGHAIVPTTGADAAGQQLAAYQSALARANAVKQALIAAGADAAKIVTEAAAGTGDRADVLVEY